MPTPAALAIVDAFLLIRDAARHAGLPASAGFRATADFVIEKIRRAPPPPPAPQLLQRIAD